MSRPLTVPTRLLHLRGVHVGGTAPSSPLAHHWWVDTSSNPWLLKVWDAAEEEWETVGAAGGGGSVAVDDDGTKVTSEASRLNFGTGLSVTDDGGGEVTIDADAGGQYAETVGDGTEVTFDVEHGLGTSAVVVAAWEVSSGERLTPAMLILNDNEVRVTFPSAPDEDDARVVVLASSGSGGGAGGGWAEIERHDVTSTEGSFDFDNIPQTFDDLVIDAYLKTNRNASSGIDRYSLRFGGTEFDTGSNYSWLERFLGSSSSTSTSGNATLAEAGWTSTTNVSDGGFGAHSRTHIYRYADPSQWRRLRGEFGSAWTGQQFEGRYAATWRNATDPIQRIRVIAKDGDFVDGFAVLYGVSHS